MKTKLTVLGNLKKKYKRKNLITDSGGNLTTLRKFQANHDLLGVQAYEQSYFI